MAIKEITVKNFKSFSHLSLQLSSLNVLIGANAAGKSNLLELFRFLKNINQEGLENAIALSGGVSYLLNRTIGSQKPLSIKITYESDARQRHETKSRLIGSHLFEATYEFSLRFEDEKPIILTDQLILTYEFVHLTSPAEIKETLGIGQATLRVSEHEIAAMMDWPTSLTNAEKKGMSFHYEHNMALFPPNTLLLETPNFELMHHGTDSLSRVAFYDIDPKLSKKAIPLTGKKDLAENGENLPNVVKRILENEEQRRQFLNLVSYLLPFVRDVQVEGVTNQHVFLSVQETFSNTMPASLISDGTISLIALVVALYFAEKPLLVFEEIERNIHPHLLARLVEMMEEVSAQKQILITTHHPELIQYVALENLILLSRDEQGFSKVSRPVESQEVQTFLEHEIGISELFSQNLLAVAS